MTTTTSNMGLVLPDVGVTSGTQWASLLNAAQQVIDSHDHSTGKGVKITPSGMNISSDLSFGSNNATTLRSVRFNNQSSFTPTANDLACFYVLNNEIYYRDGVGNTIQITSAGSLNTAGFSLSSLTIRDTAFTLQYFGDTSRQANFDLSLVSTATTRTYRLPDVTDTIVTNTSTSALTNKDIDGGSASNTNRITIPKNTKSALDGLTRKAGTVVYAQDQAKVYVDNGTSLTAIGSGSAGLYAAVDFEDLTTGGISTFADGAVSIPVDGTGGSPNSTFVNSASSPLRGSYSGLFTKSGTANRQGEGFSLPITLASADTAKTIQVAFDWSASSTMPSSSMVFYVYDVTNATIITPSVTTLPTGNASQYTVAFNATTSTSYRLIWMISSTTTTDFTVKIDQIQVSPVVRPIVAGVGDWTQYTTTLSAGLGGGTASTFYYKRLGDTLQIRGIFTTGTVAASTPTISLPAGLTIDTSKLPSSTAYKWSTGRWTNENQAAQTFSGASVSGVLTYSGTSNTTLQMVMQVASGTYTTQNANVILGSTQVIEVVDALIPIAEWSSNITLATTAPAIEYASNSSSTDADDTSSFVSGATGSVGVIGTTAMTAVRKKRIQFSTPVQPTDRLQIELLDTSIAGAQWIPLSQNPVFNRTVNQPISPFTTVNSAAYYGIGMVPVSSTQYDIMFPIYANMNSTTYGSAGAAWTAFTNVRWRVAKISSIGGAELAPATELSQGTVAYSQWASYTPSLTNMGTSPTNILGRYRREGDSLRVKVSFTSGSAVPASIGSVSIPGTYTIDTSKLMINSTTASTGEIIGKYDSNTSAASSLGNILAHTSTSTSLVYLSSNFSSAGSHLLAGNTSTAITSSSPVQIEFLIPISGWA